MMVLGSGERYLLGNGGQTAILTEGSLPEVSALTDRRDKVP